MDELDELQNANAWWEGQELVRNLLEDEMVDEHLEMEECMEEEYV